ncbi:uncharacterized protein LOC127093664 [Lathyrus oleraceus]|uniref:uncharacterized protein LOC127093664 n=1 Tax=Pisum sativum TaxID=3888 RepID=UPI0021D0BE27|nr:uncharacterized protein LOC127093664 [Pisum sativum]
MKKATELNEFIGFQLNEVATFNILHLSDDTILIGGCSWKNLWSAKAILRWFELVSGLRVIFFRNNIYGVNVKNNFIQTTSSFLFCYIDRLPFKFLGEQVDSRPRRASLWRKVVDMLRQKLSSWKSRLLSIGDMIVRINVVLNSILVYTLSLQRSN